MKETGFGEFEEVILLLVGILEEDAYAFRVSEEFESQTKRPVSIGAVHSALNRLEEKGFLRSSMGKSTSERGGRRKRIYTLTAHGQRTLASARDFRMALWKQFPAFANKLNFGLI
jgi:PadR family transcriptional regulator, regulatory protein PadR